MSSKEEPTPDALAEGSEDRKALVADGVAAKINPDDMPHAETSAMDLGVVGSSVEETNPRAGISDSLSS